MNPSTTSEIASLLRAADSVLFITGAGISADSGLPTYRGVGGLYDGDETEDGVAIEQALSGPMFARCPELTWKYLWQIGTACRGAVPNPAHTIIADMESKKESVWVVTQNVDGLHRAAGSKKLVEVHGNIYDLICIECGCKCGAEQLLAHLPHSADGTRSVPATFPDPPPLPPRCAECQGILRPEVVLFGEFLSTSVIDALSELTSTPFDMIFAVGTTAVFPYIREPIIRAEAFGIPTVEVNPSETMLSDRFRYCLRLGAAEAMQQLWNIARG